MVQTSFALILYFRIAAHKTACHTLSKVFLNQRKHGTCSADVGGTFHTGVLHITHIQTHNIGSTMIQRYDVELTLL